MAVVTRIEAQKKRAHRVNIYLDDEFAFGLSHDVLVRFDLARGDVLSPEAINEIKAAEAVQAAKTKAIDLIGRRLRSESEIRSRLAEKDFPEAAVDQVVEDLLRVGLLNDRQFAEAFIRTRMIQKPSGRRLLAQELRQKGVSPNLIESALDDVLNACDIEETIRTLAVKRIRQLPDDRSKARKRLTDFLLRRGFAWEHVRPVVDDIIGRLGEEPESDSFFM